LRIRTVADIGRSNTHRLKEKYAQLGKKSLTVGIHKKDNKHYRSKGKFGKFLKSLLGETPTTAQVGFWQEFGHYASGGRSFILPKVWLRIFSLDESEHNKMIEEARAAFIYNDNIDKALKQLGKYMRDRIKERIYNNEVKPHSNKDGTTLIDTGQLVESINFELKNAGKNDFVDIDSLMESIHNRG